MIDYNQRVKSVLEMHANPVNAEGQKAYMRNLFEFYGIKAPVRKNAQRELLIKSALPAKEHLHDIVIELWNQEEREFQYFAMEFTKKYTRQFSAEDMELLEYMVTHKSWWDTVDFIAAHLMGSFFQKYPQLQKQYSEKWLSSGNMWLQRSALLFQLKYKERLDTNLLESNIQPLLGSSEFFINKAIGWVLREYSKTNPDWVQQYAAKTSLQPLSRKEALRLIK